MCSRLNRARLNVAIDSFLKTERVPTLEEGNRMEKIFKVVASLAIATNNSTGKESMEIDNPIESNGSTAGVKENGLHLYPVSATDSSEVAHSGCFLDRYLYLPKRLQEPMRKKGGFASKLSIEHFIRASFPGADVDAFFALFSWKIPAKKLHVNKGSEEKLNAVITLLLEEISKQLGSDSQFGAMGCKASNKICNSLVETRVSTLEPMACNICCSEPSFCRDCCCILCYKTINSSYGGYSFIKCEAMVGYNIICGHVAHIDYALRSYMAGTVGGSIGLDAE
ncbi:Protein root UVB sensitive 6 [Camellia lanceoleosa]|uniref:Protein root UVB sensitive 6 n=1 Tax=Camellia lanceoleosa TaxID=1840588 RepID=A0ACC0H1R4_9ERIC|nr:Protein root UVB sensitive 6 [Camellia lanceoleosa]